MGRSGCRCFTGTHWHRNARSHALCNSLLLLSREEDAYIEFLRLRNVLIAEAPPALIPPLALGTSDVMQRLRCKAPSPPRFTAGSPQCLIPLPQPSNSRIATRLTRRSVRTSPMCAPTRNTSARLFSSSSSSITGRSRIRSLRHFPAIFPRAK